jgi:uncharacterized protein YkwD
MRSSWVIGALCAASALAVPIEKRVYETELIVVTVTETIYPTATHAPQQGVAQAPQDTSTVVPPPPPPPTTTVVPPPPPPPPATTAAPAPTGATGYQSTILENHNVHRANHSAADLTWSSDLEASAQSLAGSCVYHHDT